MTKPKPKIALEFTDRATYQSLQVLSASGTWSVYYDDQPINLKSTNRLTDRVGSKYKKTSFSNPGHAINLCKKLNKMFKTTRFTVVKHVSHEKVF